MKNLIKKILKEELDDGLDWMRTKAIDANELRDLILKTGATSIPFEIVHGDLDLRGTPIKDLGNLQQVDGYLDLYKTPIKDLDNLQQVDGFLELRGTPLTKKYSETEIRAVVQVDGNIYQ